MTLKELPERWTAEEVDEFCDDDMPPGWIVRDTRFDTAWHVTPDAWKNLTVPQLRAVTPAGQDVDHISRVTGYFSKTSGWNKGKQQELKDRYRGGDV